MSEAKKAPVPGKKVVPQKKQLPTQPKGTQDVLGFDKIVVPEELLKIQLTLEKMQKVIEFVKRTGYLYEPLTTAKESKVLKGGYRRYVVAKIIKMDQVPVVYEY
ncbi:hypothetical protein ACQCPQ_29155 (plasmid) [Priestia megaterium]|uniref:hypothetical protein n=1 Tax=Priestia megaterium TaxID=1404 RepID=UPI003D05C9A4